MKAAFLVIQPAWAYLFLTLFRLALATPIGWTELGCFRDSAPRALHHIVGGSNDNTVENCIDTCGERGFSLAGVEYGSECFCGNSILYGYGSSQACSYPCSGNNLETCGGPNAINIYWNGHTPYTVGPASLVTSYNGWRVTQCWQDDVWPFGYPRLLPHYPNVPIPAEQMTAEKCIDGCNASHYTSAGVEYGQECWCGNVTYPPGQSVPSYECGMPCLGDAREICGGPNLATVYTNL